MQKKIVLQYYVLFGLLSFFGLSFISGVYMTFLLRSGLTLAEANFVNAAFYVFLFIFEIPTGAFADIFGRKWSFMAACAIMGIAKLIYGASTGLWGFVFAEIVAALGLTFYTGAFDSWFVDSMKHYGNPGPLTKEIGRCNGIGQICAALGAVTGSHLFALHPVFPWIVGGWMLLVVAAMTYLIMDEPHFEKKTSSVVKNLKAMWETVKASYRYCKEDPAVRFLIVTVSLQVMSLQALNMYWQPFFGSKGFAEINFGYIFVGIKGSLAIGGFILGHVNTMNRERTFLLRAQIITGLFILVAALVPSGWIALIAFLLHEVVRGFFDPLRKAYLQSQIPSSERATIVSFSEMAPHIGGAVGLVASGLLAQTYGINATWIICGSTLIIGSLLIAKNGRK